MSCWTPPTRCFRPSWTFFSCFQHFCQHFCQHQPPERAPRFENAGAAHSLNHSREDHSTASTASYCQYKSRGQPDSRERGIDPTSCQRVTKNFLFFSIHHHNDYMAYLVYLYKLQNRQDESRDRYVNSGCFWGLGLGLDWKRVQGGFLGCWQDYSDWGVSVTWMYMYLSKLIKLDT